MPDFWGEKSKTCTVLPHASPRRGVPPLRWFITGMISLLTVANYLDRGNLAVAAPLIMQDLGVSHTLMGLILSAFVWPYALMNLPSGWLVDRFGPRLLLTVAGVLWSCAAALTGFASSLAQFMVLRIGLGVSEAPMFPAALKATHAWFPAHEKALAISTYIAATQVGLALAPLFATFLMVRFGWRAMFVIMGVAGLLPVLFWAVFYRDPERHVRLGADERASIRAGQSGAPAAPPLSGAEWWGLFRHPQIWVMIIGGFCLQYTFWFYISWLPTYLERVHGFTLTRAGFFSALPFLAGTFGVLSGGRLSDGLVRRGLPGLLARRAVVSGGALLTAFSMFATLLSASAAEAVAFLTLGMFTYSLCSGCYWALATEVVTTERPLASVGSIQNFGGFLGGAFAPVATGLIVDHGGGFGGAILTAALLAVISSALYGWGLRRKLPL
jgi:MFS family permease